MAVVPPGGLAGFNQMTPASKFALFPPGRAGVRRRRKGASAKRVSRRRVKRASGSKNGRLPKFGSPAWRKKFKLDKKR